MDTFIGWYKLAKTWQCGDTGSQCPISAITETCLANYCQKLTVCVVSKSMDMETMLTRSKAFDFPCQLHRGGFTLADQDKRIAF